MAISSALALAIAATLAAPATAQISLYDFDGPSTTVLSLPFFFPFAQTIAGDVVSADTAPVTAAATIALSCRDAACPGPRSANYTIGTKTIAFAAAPGAGWHCPISTASVTCTVSADGTTTTRTDDIATLVPLGSRTANAPGVADPVNITAEWNIAAPLLGLYGGTTPLPTVFGANSMGPEVQRSISSVVSASLASLMGGRSRSPSTNPMMTTSSPPVTSSALRGSSSAPSPAMTSSASTIAPASTGVSPMSISTTGGSNNAERVAAPGAILGAAALLIGAIAV